MTLTPAVVIGFMPFEIRLGFYFLGPGAGVEDNLMVGSGNAWLGLDSVRRRFVMLGWNELSHYGGIGVVFVLLAGLVICSQKLKFFSY